MCKTDKGTVVLELSEDEAAYLDDILSMWIDGYQEARDATIDDPTIGAAEDLLVLHESLKTQEHEAVMIRYKLREGTFDNG